MASSLRVIPQSSGTEIIRDMMEQDAYIDSMGNASRIYPRCWAEYVIKDRDNTVYPKGFAGLVKEKIQDLKSLKLTPKAKKFLETKWPFVSKIYWDWLEEFRYNPEYITLWQDDGGHLDGRIKGPWMDGMQFGSVIVAVIVQTRNEEFGFYPDDNWLDELFSIIDHLLETGGRISEFSFRRRPYAFMQDLANDHLMSRGGYYTDGGIYVGSSNKYESMRYDTTPKGSVAHEWYMMHAAKYGLENANLTSLTDWRAIFGDSLGTICLTDTWTSRYFWAKMPACLAHLFLSYRQDSKDPIEWTKDLLRFITHPSINIDPKLITGLYTNRLDQFEVRRIHQFANPILKEATYGAGELFGGNIKFFKKTPAYFPANIVTKPIAFSFDDGDTYIDTCKTSDDIGKITGKPKVVEEYLKIINNTPFPY